MNRYILIDEIRLIDNLKYRIQANFVIVFNFDNAISKRLLFLKFLSKFLLGMEEVKNHKNLRDY